MARAQRRGRSLSLFRFVPLALTMAVLAGLLTAAAVVYGDDLTSVLGPSDTDSTASDGTGNDMTSSAAEPGDCSPRLPPSAEPVAAVDAETVLLELSRRLYDCADRVVIATADPAARWTAASLAADDEAVMLLSGPGSDSPLLDELDRLSPEQVVVVGTTAETTEMAETLDGDWELIEQQADPAAEPPKPPPDGSALWALDGSDPDLAALLAPAAGHVGASIVEIGQIPGGTDGAGWFGASPDAVERLRTAEAIQLIGSFTDTDAWQLEVLRSGVELPGGGFRILNDEGEPQRRYIAFYGAPGTSALGVLGEQDPAATLERMQPLLADYQTDDGAVVIPTFELISTVAAAEAGTDGDYSNEIAVADLRPYVDHAADNDVYVLLDLQPGRTDFLTQAKIYEELLREPHVGLALDPEWRLAPDQFHMRQLGSVDAAEVNEVSAWLADLVRSNALPQKMLLIHQFQQSMVTNRSAIEQRPELAFVIQMDGQGPLGTKYGTLDALIQGGENAHWRWGWKNFYDEDTPMATPAQTLDVEPEPVYVSYQ